MSEIRRVLRRARMRLLMAAFLRNSVFALTAGIIAIILLRISSVVLGLSIDWWTLATWAPVAVFGLAVIWTLLRVPMQQAVARRVDEGADLKETLSTALAVQGLPDAWCQTVMETASAKARTVDVRRAIPVHAPRSWPMPLTAALACVVVWLLPLPQDVLGKMAAKEKQEEQKKIVEQTKAEAKEAIAKVEEQLKKLDPDAAEPNKTNEEQTPKSNNPEDIRRAAIKKIEGMKDKLEQMRSDSEKAQAADALKDMLKQLKNQPGPMEDVVKALAKGDFAAAQEELAKLEAKMASGDMSAEAKEQMAKQAESLKSQMEKLAANKKDLEEKMKAAGLDPKLASMSKEDLKKALENAKNMTEEQKQQLQKQMAAKQNASESCQSMAQCMSQMAQSMSKQGQDGESGEQGESQQAMAQMANQLSDMEMAQQEAAQMDAAMSEAAEQLKSLCEGMGECNNPGMGECEGGLQANKGDSDKQQQINGPRQGGRAQAQGGSGSEAPADETWMKRKATSKTGAGPIIGSTMIQGEQVKGESRAEFAAVADAAEANASEALENNVIPREYHDVVKHYFGRLKAKSQAQETKKTADSEAKDEKPAEKKEEAKK